MSTRGQRRHARRAAGSSRPSTRARAGAGHAAAGQSDSRFCSSPRRSQSIHDGLWLVVNGAGTGGRAQDRGPRRRRQDRHGAGDFEQGRERAQRHGQGPARSRLVRVLRAARQPGDRRRHLRRARRARLSRPRRSRKHIIETYFAEKEGRPLPTLAAAATRAARSGPRGRRGRCAQSRAPADTPADDDDAPVVPVARPAQRSGGPALNARTAPLPPHRLGADRRGRCALCGIGLAMIYSTTGGPGRIYWTQVYAVGLGLVAMGVALVVDYRSLADKSHFFYLAARRICWSRVLFFGVGARRLAALDRSRRLQPAAVGVRQGALALVLAKLLGESRRRRPHQQRSLHRRRRSLRCRAARRAPARPRHGGDAAADPLRRGLRRRHADANIFGMLAVVAVLAAPVAWQVRAAGLPERTHLHVPRSRAGPRGAGYQQIQARITVGSGGRVGQGFMQGTQGQLRFLPVAHNDFIFSVLAEEQGFVGVARRARVVLFVIMRSLEAARLAKDRLGAYLVLGVLRHSRSR